MGSQTVLHKIFGWYSSSPINLTKQEVRGRKPSWADMGGGGGGGTSRSFSDLLRPSDNPVDKQSDMETLMNSDIGRPIIETYAEEASQLDINKQQSVWFECNDSSVEEDLNKMLERIGVEDSIYSICFQVAGKGNHFRRVLWNNSEGVVGFVSVPHQDIRRVWDHTSKRLLGFTWQGQQPSEPSIKDNEHLFSPWSFIHFRNQLDPNSEYGMSLIEHLYPMFKRMQYGLNQMTLYRLHCMPTKHLFWVDGGTQDFTTIMEQVHMFESMMRQKSMIGTAGMFESRFDPPAMDSMLFIPRRTDEKSEYQILQGDKEVPDVYDLEYLTKCFYGGARIPKAYIGHGDDGAGLAQASLVSQDIRFARMIRVLRRPIIYGFWQLACIHLALKGKSPEDYKVKVRMSKISALEEEVNAATLESQMNIAKDFTQLCKDLEIPNQATMELVFKEFLHVPKTFVSLAKLAMAASSAASGNDSSSSMFGGMGGGGGGGMGDMGGDFELPDEGGDTGDEGTPVEGKRIINNLLVEGIKNMRASKANRELAVESVKSLNAHLAENHKLRIGKKTSLVEHVEENVGTMAKAGWPMPKPKMLVLTESVSGGAKDSHGLLIENVQSLKKASEFILESYKVVPQNQAVKIVENARKSRQAQKKKPKAGKTTDSGKTTLPESLS